MWESLYPKIQPYCTSENPYRKKGPRERPDPEVKAHGTLGSKVSVRYPEGKLCQFNILNVRILTSGLNTGSKVGLSSFHLSFHPRATGEKEAEV